MGSFDNGKRVPLRPYDLIDHDQSHFVREPLEEEQIEGEAPDFEVEVPIVSSDIPSVGTSSMQTAKRGRGRPRKNPVVSVLNNASVPKNLQSLNSPEDVNTPPRKRPRGRPRKENIITDDDGVESRPDPVRTRGTLAAARLTENRPTRSESDDISANINPDPPKSVASRPDLIAREDRGNGQCECICRSCKPIQAMLRQLFFDNALREDSEWIVPNYFALEMHHVFGGGAPAPRGNMIISSDIVGSLRGLFDEPRKQVNIGVLEGESPAETF